MESASKPGLGAVLGRVRLAPREGELTLSHLTYPVAELRKQVAPPPLTPAYPAQRVTHV